MYGRERRTNAGKPKMLRLKNVTLGGSGEDAGERKKTISRGMGTRVAQNACCVII